MRSFLFLVVLVLLQPWAAAQDFDFRPPATVSDATTPAVMRDLAERILPVYQEDNPERYLASLSALQLVAGNYTAAYASRQSLRDRRRSADSARPVSRTVILDIYAHARAVQAADRVPFAQAFALAFKDAIPRLGDQDALAVSGWLATPAAALQDPVQKSFDQRRAKGNIALADALDLIEAYATYDAYRNFAPSVGALNAEEDRRRYTTEEDVLIETPDGASLAAVLVRPRSPGKPLPTLLEYTLYTGQNYAREVAAHGYVGVVAYARGRGKSTGKLTPYQHDGDDVRTVINWIAKQSWSDGRVGMYGGAYSGFTQWAAAKKLPAALKAIATSAGGIAPGIDVPDEGNIFRNYAYRWSLYVTGEIDEKEFSDDAQWRALDEAWYAQGTKYRDFGRLHGKPNALFQRWLNHPSYDRFWQNTVPYGKQFAKIDIPVLATTGYYAGGEAGALYYFTQHQRYDPRADHTLLIGPYDDGLMQHGLAPVLRGLTVDSAALVDLRELRYQWFDHVLKGAPKPALLQDRVNYEVMGANEWRHGPSLESMGNGSQKFYLDATAVGAGHRLAPKKGAEARFVSQTVDLADRSDAKWTPPAEIAAESISTRNGATFVSDPLTTSLELNGLLTGRFDLTVNKMDVDLSLAMYELLPGGEYVQLFEPYAFRASYALDRVHRHLLKAGERQELTFRSERLMSRRLQVGSRLVLVVEVNKRPDQQINYGTGNDVAEESKDDGRVPVKIRWYGGSYIEVPVRHEPPPAPSAQSTEKQH